MKRELFPRAQYFGSVPEYFAGNFHLGRAIIICMADPCRVETKLAQAAAVILTRLIELTTAQLEASREGRRGDVLRLDKELENTVGDKERALGALDEHRKEHGCFQRC